MKKIVLLVTTMALMAVSSSCGMLAGLPADQTSGQAQTGSNGNSSASGTDILGSILGALGVSTDANSILGTWTYQEPAVQFSSDNLLAKAGGGVASAKVVEKIKPYFEMAGIKPGKMSVTLNKDKTCKVVLKNKTYEGTYVYDSKADQITIKTAEMEMPTAYISVAGNEMALTFDSSKILSLLQSAGSVAGSNSTLGTIAQISTAYDGMKTGFKFTK